MRVLIADDQANLFPTLKPTLLDQGYAVELTQTGQAALARATGERFDLIVLDLALPGTTDLTICRRLRNQGDQTPILIVTARNTVDECVRGLDAGTDDYLMKPFHIREFFARLHALTI